MGTKQLKLRRHKDSCVDVAPLAQDRAVALDLDYDGVHLTPSEARRLAAYLVTAANAVAPPKVAPAQLCTCPDAPGAYDVIEMFGHEAGCPRGRS